MQFISINIAVENKFIFCGGYAVGLIYFARF